MTLIDVTNEAGRVSIRIYVDTQWILGYSEYIEIQIFGLFQLKKGGQ
jgi:hypothetical protein